MRVSFYWGVVVVERHMLPVNRESVLKHITGFPNVKFVTSPTYYHINQIARRALKSGIWNKVNAIFQCKTIAGEYIFGTERVIVLALEYTSTSRQFLEHKRLTKLMFNFSFSFVLVALKLSTHLVIISRGCFTPGSNVVTQYIWRCSSGLVSGAGVFLGSIISALDIAKACGTASPINGVGYFLFLSRSLSSDIRTFWYVLVGLTGRAQDICVVRVFSISISISNYISQISITITIEFNNLIYSIRTI